MADKHDLEQVQSVMTSKAKKQTTRKAEVDIKASTKARRVRPRAQTSRPEKDPRIINALGTVFRKYGYDAASLSLFHEATGLGKSSLYHHFPEGKAQMVQEVIELRAQWMRQHVFEPLRDSRPPNTRIDEMLDFADKHYQHGLAVCLLGTLALSENSKLYRDSLSAVFSEWIDALATPLIDAGMRRGDAVRLAEMSILTIQGALLMTKALGTNRPFVHALKQIRSDLLDSLNTTNH